MPDTMPQPTTKPLTGTDRYEIRFLGDWRGYAVIDRETRERVRWFPTAGMAERWIEGMEPGPVDPWLWWD